MKIVNCQAELALAKEIKTKSKSFCSHINKERIREDKVGSLHDKDEVEIKDTQALHQN